MLLAGLIIRNTWRRTTLTANAREVTLEFVLLFTQTQAEAVTLAELRLRAPNTIGHLFTDHRAAELEPIQRELNRALAGLPPQVQPLAARPVIQLAKPEPNPRTL